jgi:hypothetical protein
MQDTNQKSNTLFCTIDPTMYLKMFGVYIENVAQGYIFAC